MQTLVADGRALVRALMLLAFGATFQVSKRRPLTMGKGSISARVRVAQFWFRSGIRSVVVGLLLAAFMVVPSGAVAAALPTAINENMTLTAGGSPYTGTSVTISSGVTVAVEPGALVKLTGTLTAKGTLDVNGTAEKPVVFTSSTNTAAGQWTGIVLQAGAGSSNLSHAELRYGKTAISISGGISPVIESSFIHHNNSTGISASSGGPEIANNEISDNGGTGINYSYTGSSNQLNIHDNVIERSASGGIRVADSGTASFTHVDFSGNVVEETTGGKAISFEGATLPPDVDENELSGNSQNGIWVSGAVAKSVTWEDRGYPMVSNSSGITVASGVTLTLDPGLVVKSDNTTLAVKGTLVADGTKADPIAFTSLNDDSIDGDTNGNGSATKPAPGNWRLIEFTTSGTGTLDHAKIKYGGFSSSGGAYTSLVIKCPCPTPPPVTNSEISYSDTAAILVVGGGSPQITDNVITHNDSTGISASSGGPEIANNEISDNGGTGINYSYTGSSNQLNIHDNVIERSASGGIRVADSGTASFTHVDFSGNVVEETTGGKAISFEGATLPPDVDENELSGNSQNGIWVSGTVAKSVTWEDRGYPMVSTWSGITVAEGTTLTLDPGFTIKGDGRGMTVKGTLIADGTAAQPITYTSLNDDSIDGDTNGNGSATKPAPGNWPKIEFTTSATGVVDHAHIRYGGFSNYGGDYTMIAIKCPCPTPPTIRYSTITDSDHAGISVLGDPGSTADGGPMVSHSTFRRMDESAIDKSGKNPMWAPYNDYGCASGPKPSGCGEKVGKLVDWAPLEGGEGPCRGDENQNCKHGADPVALATGQLAYSHSDIRLSGKSAPLEFTRSYNSGDPSDASLGTGWSHSGLISAMELDSGDAIVRHADGRTDAFNEVEGAYLAPSGVSDRLVKIEGAFRLTKLDRTVYDFRADGRIATITDDHGLKTTYGYDGDGRLATIADPSSQALMFSYDAFNHIAKVTDTTGREVKYTYSTAGDLQTVTDALGGVTEYAYDAEHRITLITDPRKNVILKNVYDGQGRVVEQLDGLENLWTLEYEEGETTVTEPEGGEIAYGFDEQGRVVSETDQLGNTTTTSYNPAGYAEEIVRPGEAKWEFGYDAAGNLTSVVDPEEGERNYEYDGQNRLIRLTDAREETWVYEWSEDNDLEKVIDPAEGETTLTYDPAGQPLTITDPNEDTTTFTYDGRGNRLTVEDALEHTTSYDYDSRNHLTSKTEPGLEPEALGRNALGDLLSRTTPEGHETEYDYDANGMLTQVTDPAEGVWEIELNAMGRPTAYVDPLEQRTEIEYDGNLNPIEVTDRRGKETTYGYDLANRLAGVEAPEGGDWQFDYDGRGNRTSVVDPRENETTFDFDLCDRMTEVAEPFEAVTSYGYDPVGNMTSFTDPRENTTSLSYDALGRLTEVEQPLEKTTTFSYDGVGNMLSRTTPAGTLEYEYDVADRLQSITGASSTLRSFDYDSSDRLVSAVDAQGDEIQIGYDDDGRMISIDDDRGQTVSREYDSRGNLIEQVDGRGTLEYGYDKLSRMVSLVDPQAEALGFSYDPEGNLTGAELPNEVVRTNAYDDAGRLIEMTSEGPGESVLESFEYGYDSAGNRISKADRLAQETTYAYDQLNRLTEFNPPGEGSTSYDYDAAGNRTEAGGTIYSFNALDQLTSSSDGTTYEYDATGRLAEIDHGEQATIYGWNLFEELTSVDDGSQETAYTYDAIGRRAKRDDGTSIQGAHYGDFTDRPILDTDAEGATVSSYVQGPLGLVEQRSGKATSFPLADVHGDLTAIVDDEAGVVSRQNYDPWGEQLAGPELDFGYLGAQQRRTDPAAGLVQMGARPYGSELGSFISEDPLLGHVGFGASLNRYAYVWDNPLLYFDLTGHSILGDAADAIADTAGPAVDGAGQIIDDAWDSTADERTDIGIAGDGNGGALSEAPGVVKEAPGFVSERAQDLLKTLNDAADCLTNAVRHPSEDQECLPGLPDDPLEPTDFEDPPEPPNSVPPPPPVPPTPLPGRA